MSNRQDSVTNNSRLNKRLQKTAKTSSNLPRDAIILGNSVDIQNYANDQFSEHNARLRSNTLGATDIIKKVDQEESITRLHESESVTKKQSQMINDEINSVSKKLN